MRTPSASMSPLEAALFYRQELGWSVVPINPPSKRPVVEWTALQREAATPDLIRAWWRWHPQAGVGIVTGAVSRLWVIDVDAAAGRERLDSLELPACPRVLTGKGEHRYYERPRELRNTAKRLAGLDTRGDGGYVVAPPTMHPSGRRYAWQVAPWDIPPPTPPSALVELFGAAAAREAALDPNDYSDLLLHGSEQGRRHDDMTRLVGHLLAHGLSQREVAILLHPWVDRCRPTFPYEELYQTVRDLAEAEARNHPERHGERASMQERPPTAGRGPRFRAHQPLEDIIHDFGVRLVADAEGRFLRGNCPLHNDHDRGLWVAPKAQKWGCRVCGIKSDAQGFYELTMRRRQAS